MQCQHCLAVCPTAALSIMGVNPDTCVSFRDTPSYEQTDALVRNRRSVRQFKKENVSPDRLDKLIKTAANAPTGKNTRKVHLHIIDNLADMDRFREMVISTLERYDAEGKLDEKWKFFSAMAKAYRMGTDIIFRGAPHLVVATVPEDAPCPDADGLITLSYLELTASSLGLGTVWLGYLMYILQFVPEVKNMLNIPENHRVSYAMLIGEPSVRYHRGVQRDEISVSRVHFV